MKIINFLTILSFAFLCCSSSCKEEKDLTTLPPETQTGANTFGCYVKDKLFVSSKKALYFGTPNLIAQYVSVDKVLYIDAVNREMGTIRITSFLDAEKDDYSNIVYRSKIANATYSNFDLSGLVITRFDTINKIVSGRFDFILTSEDDPSEKVNITNGRFDVSLY